MGRSVSLIQQEAWKWARAGRVHSVISICPPPLSLAQWALSSSHRMALPFKQEWRGKVKFKGHRNAAKSLSWSATQWPLVVPHCLGCIPWAILHGHHQFKGVRNTAPPANWGAVNKEEMNGHWVVTRLTILTFQHLLEVHFIFLIAFNCLWNYLLMFLLICWLCPPVECMMCEERGLVTPQRWSPVPPCLQIKNKTLSSVPQAVFRSMSQGPRPFWHLAHKWCHQAGSLITIAGTFIFSLLLLNKLASVTLDTD